MRRRLLVVLLLFSVLAVTAFAWPLLLSTASERTQEFVRVRMAHLDRIADMARAGAGDAANLEAEVSAHQDVYDDGMVVVDTSRNIVAGGLSTSEEDISEAITAALRNQPTMPSGDLRPWSRGHILFAVPIGTDTAVNRAVLLRTSVNAAAAEILWQWALVLATALAAIVVCVLVALLLARWVLRPMRELERGVLAVAAGERDAHIGEHLGPRELRALAGSFNRMSAAVATAAEQQNRLVADASHELRGPLARLGLTVEALDRHVTPDGMTAYRRILAEVGELGSLFDSLLNLAAADRTATELAAGTADADSCDATELLVERLETWLPAADQAGVRLSAPDTVAPVLLALPETELKQVMDVVIDNAIKYAGTGANVRLDCEVIDGRGRVAVADDGPGLTETDRAAAPTRFWRSQRGNASTGSGLGLAIADRLVTTRGGTLSVLANQPRGLVVELIIPLAGKVTS